MMADAATPLMQCFTFIIENLNLTEVIPFMMTKGSLKRTEVTNFLPFSKYDIDKNTEFLMMLDRKGKMEEIFIEALEYSNQKNIADPLKSVMAQSAQNGSCQSRNTENAREGDQTPEKRFNVDIYCESLKELYRSQKFDDTTFVWPTIGPEESTNEEVDLFECVKNQHNSESRVTNIFILIGKAGSGKTTIVKKIAHDWAKQVSALKHYKILILIEFSTLQSKSYKTVVEMVAEKFSSVCDDQHFLSETFKNNKTLIIIDGYSCNENSVYCTELKQLLRPYEYINAPFDLFIGKRHDSFVPCTEGMNGRKTVVLNLHGLTKESQQEDFMLKRKTPDDKMVTIKQTLAEIAISPSYLRVICILPVQIIQSTARIFELWEQICKQLIYNYQCDNEETDVPKLLGFEQQSTNMNAKFAAIEQNMHEFKVLGKLGMHAFKQSETVMNAFHNDPHFARELTQNSQVYLLSDSEADFLSDIRLITNRDIEFHHMSFGEYFAALNFCYWNENSTFKELNVPHDSPLDRFIWDAACDLCQKWISKQRPTQNSTYPWLCMRERLDHYFRSKQAIVFHFSERWTTECLTELLKHCTNALLVTVYGDQSAIERSMDFSEQKLMQKLVFKNIRFATPNQSAFRLPSSESRIKQGTNLWISFVKCSFTEACLEKSAQHIRESKLHQVTFVDFDVSKTFASSNSSDEKASLNLSDEKSSTLSDANKYHFLEKLELIWTGKTRTSASFSRQNLESFMSYFDFASEIILSGAADINFDIVLPKMNKLELLSVKNVNISHSETKLNIKNFLPQRYKNALWISSICFEHAKFSLLAWNNFMDSLIEHWLETKIKIKRLELLKCSIENKEVTYFLKHLIQSHASLHNDFFIEELCIDNICANFSHLVKDS